MADSQIRNSIRCQIPNCNNVALGVFNGKWICGLCLLKIERKIKEQNKKMLEIFENEISGENENIETKSN